MWIIISYDRLQITVCIADKHLKLIRMREPPRQCNAAGVVVSMSVIEVSVLPADLMNGICKHGPGTYMGIVVFVLFINIQIQHQLPKPVCFYPLNLLWQYIISVRLLLPRVAELLFIFSDIFLPSYAIICIVIYNCKIHTVINTRMLPVLHPYCQNPC